MGVNVRRAEPGDAPAFEAIQRAAYARNRVVLGVEPIPLMTPGRDVVERMETWLLEEDGDPVAALALERDADALLIWSVATRPEAEGRGHGGRLLDLAARRAIETGARAITLYTGEALTGNVAWYRRRGFAIDRVEDRGDRRIVHMSKHV